MTPRTTGTELRAIILPDGRWLAFALFGDVRGTPVVAFHETPGNHEVWRAGHQAAVELGVCLIAPDRPGWGSSPQVPAGEQLDWPTDLAVLADAIGLGSFGLLGIGDGAALAATCARSLPDRITRLGLVSCPAAAQHDLPGPAQREWSGPLRVDRFDQILGWFRDGRSEHSPTDHQPDSNRRFT